VAGSAACSTLTKEERRTVLPTEKKEGKKKVEKGKAVDCYYYGYCY
jgi:hypothetical protein